MNDKQKYISVLAILAVLAVLFAGLSYMLSPKLIFGMDSCIIEKKVGFAENVTINDCGHHLNLQIDDAKYAAAPFRFANLTSFSVDGEDFVSRIKEGDPVQIIIYEGTVNFRIKPDLIFGKDQGIIFMRPDSKHKDWMIRVREIDSSGVTLQIVHGSI